MRRKPPREPCPTCTGRRYFTRPMCEACWRLVPRQLRDRYWRTRPNTPARQDAYLDAVGCIIGGARRGAQRASTM